MKPTSGAVLSVLVPGEPVAQGRPRFARRGAFVRAYDPPKSRSWKGVVQVHALEALRAADVDAPAYADGPVSVLIEATWTLAASKHRKAAPVARQPRASRPDAENVAKAVLDALTGLAWTDDAQVAELRVVKWTGAQGEAPGVRVSVWPLVAA